jgi:hypothetical protein
MSMHLEGPWLSTTGKKKGKQKFASAEQKRQYEQLTADWQQLKTQYEPVKKTFNRSFTNSKMPKLAIPEGRGTTHIKSLSTGIGTAAKVEAPAYTGTLIKGIGTMHKSNAVPIFSDQEAVEISTMRRG